MTKPRFFGQEHCLIDQNGRVKLPTRLLRDFQDFDQPEIMLHCLPENALAVYPLSIWKQMRENQPRPAAKAGDSLYYRRQLRRFGGFTLAETISKQGRITIPPLFREPLSLTPGSSAVAVGCEIGVEIWNSELWRQEQEMIREYEQRLAQAEIEKQTGEIQHGRKTQ